MLLPSDLDVEVTEGSASHPLQVAKYLFGIGADARPVAAFAAGTLGTGLVTRLVRGYTFLSRNYQPGDRIYLVGFSRGAYTVRALAGLIAASGLLDWNGMGLTASGPASYAAGIHAWYDYRASCKPTDPGFAARLASVWVDIQGWATQAFHDAPPALKYVEGVPLTAFGVWDTVGALGIPDYCARTQQCVDVFEFDETPLSTNVQQGIHAVSVDEQRVNFTPTLWVTDPRVVQLLFCGADADVGGGYPMANCESGLSDCSLQWLLQKLMNAGLHASVPPTIDPTKVSDADLAQVS